MTINAKEVIKEYWKIIQYMDGMWFLVGGTKAVQKQIMHKSQNYLIIKD